uniref:Transmembrane protein 115 n=1 Tax=Plectus sambesii TaxID=2011161 RepID=A0A914UYD6_9BILA
MFSTKLDPVVGHVMRSSIFCKSLLLALIIGFLLSLLSEDLYKFLAIRVHGLLPPNFHVWTVVTYGLVERNIVCLVWSVCSVHLASTLLEPVWGPIELLRFLAIVQVATALIIPTLCFSVYVIFYKDEELLFRSAFAGFTAFDGAIFVAIKQFLPDSVLLATPMGRIKNCHLPMIALIVVSVLAVCQIIGFSVPLMVMVGESVAWIYLRFYQRHSNGNKGDMSEHFTWASFFPSYLQPLASAVSNPIYAFLLRMKVCQPAIRHVDFNQLHSVSVVLPDAETQDAERRRQKALRDLTERLNRQKTETSEWPDMDEGEGGGRSETARAHITPQHGSPVSFASDEMRHSVSDYADASVADGKKPLLVLEDSS